MMTKVILTFCVKNIHILAAFVGGALMSCGLWDLILV
jgi:hypothetical protein